MNVIVMSEAEDTVVLVDPLSCEVLTVGYNHCLSSASSAQRALSRARVVDVLQGVVDRPALVLTGQVADLLYTALAGHSYAVERPAVAMRARARAARAHIERMRAVGDWEIAQRVVEAAGPVISPWLGVTKLVGGVPQEGAAEYEERIRL